MPTAEEIGARVKAAKPELKDFPDKDVGERVLKAHPELSGVGAGPDKPLFSMGGSGDFRGAGASGEWGPKPARRPAMRGMPDQGFSPERALENAPVAVAVATSFLQPEVGIPALARLGVTGKALQFFVNSAARISGQAAAAGATRTGVEMMKGAPAGEAMAAGGQEAVGVGKAAAIGEAGGAVVSGVMAGAKAAAPTLKTLLKKTPAGEKYAETIRTAITEQAQGDANAIISTVANESPAEMIGEQAGMMAKKFDRITAYKATALREIPIQTALEAKLKVDIKPILRDLKSMLSAGERDAGALSSFSGAGSRELSATQGSRLGTTDTAPLVKELAETIGEAKGAKDPETALELGQKIASLNSQIRKILKAGSANTAALMQVQGDISQILATPMEKIPLSLRRVAQGIGGGDAMNPTKRLNDMIRGSLAEVGDDAVASWDTALGYYGKVQDIKEQALYGLIKKTPEKLHSYIAPQQPETATTLRKMIAETGDQDILPRVQRQWLEARVQKGGITGVREEIEKYGQKTVGNLFKEPTAARAVENVKMLSDSLNRRLTEVGVGAEKTRDILAEAAIKAGLSKIPGGRLLGALTPDALVKWAYKPEARQIATMVNGISENAPQRTVDALAQLIRRANQTSKEDRDYAAAQR